MYTFIDSICERTSLNMYILSYFRKNDSHSSILTDWYLFFSRNSKILFQLIKNLAAKRILLLVCRFIQSILHIIGKIVISFYTHFFYVSGNFVYMN